ncbi:hypothetical protein GCM10010911_54080 [Paenibacillus nasutitermitis]|uniref:Uncharacterized protein n=2 Tax=Paenibacillus nasutitermitis TaxID=1652958 RepID=A0A917E1E1_9BACL|nr:hypothetical protein GCM10010911_54080 [Paenibacillus nasutitermitis]
MKCVFNGFCCRNDGNGVVFSLTSRVSANDDCGCGQVVGAEKNKIVADLLKSDAFKAKKQELLKQVTSEGMSPVNGLLER